MGTSFQPKELIMDLEFLKVFGLLLENGEKFDMAVTGSWCFPESVILFGYFVIWE